MSNGFGEVGKAIGRVILIVAAAAVVTIGGGSVGGYMLASALGWGKVASLGMAAAGAIGVPIGSALIGSKISDWKTERARRKHKAELAKQQAAPAAPQPVSAPVPSVQLAPAAASADDTPTIFVDAVSKMKDLPADERRKYWDRLRDVFPNEVESLGGYNDQMALAHGTTPMKKLTLVKPREPKA